jgi:PTH1 family peptidyl-tRNA hydrolase
MKLIVGLGNPGQKYEATRHNAGFWLVERFAAQSGTVLRKDGKFQALVGRHGASGVWLVLPQSFMNSSGRPVQMMASFFRIAPADILVVHDELDFPPGVVRIKQGGGIAGHNGLKDVSGRLASHDYWRLRIGIGHPGERDAVTDYVLHKPGQEERAAIDAAIDRAIEVLPLVLGGDLQGAMLKLHSDETPAAPSPQAEKPAPVPAKAEADAPARPPKRDRKERREQERAAARGKTAAGGAGTKKGSAPTKEPAPAETKSTLGSFLKKLLPHSKAKPEK